MNLLIMKQEKKMIINFRAYQINQNMYKFIRTPALIKKKKKGIAQITNEDFLLEALQIPQFRDYFVGFQCSMK